MSWQINLEPVIHSFDIPGRIIRYEKFGSGHINDTYLVHTINSGQPANYIVQRINTNVFTRPDLLMDNVFAVTEYLRGVIAAENGDPLRETLTFIPTVNGDKYFCDALGKCWRCYYFIDNVIGLDMPRSCNDFYNSAVAFGTFMRRLIKFDAHTLHETIENFHNPLNRFLQLEDAMYTNAARRMEYVMEELDIARSRENDAEYMSTLKFPLRVTHNDTKLNNVLLDPDSGKGICVIDLDTVMPGYAIYDFGDSIRFGASTAAEDEKDLTKVSLNLEMYKAYTKGYLESCGRVLEDIEISMLPMGAKMMTLECAVRFLTDYLNGDKYFKIAYPEHNLDRARTQLRLVFDMEEKWEEMQEIVEQLRSDI